MTTTFSDLDLSPEILRALGDLGFEAPTPIQEQAIPYLLSEDEDLIALAQTGTGKTAAFSLPLLSQVDVSDKSSQILILSPTRELCLQICRDIEAFTKYTKGLNVVALYGGAGIREQIRGLQNGAQVVVGTPGRTLDLLNRGKLKIADLRFLVLDEADEMLSMGFQEDLDAILAGTPAEKRTVLFSATMPKEIRRMANKYMNNPHEISVITKNKSAQNVTHEYYMTHEKNRYSVLKRLADFHPDMYSIVFCRTRRETQQVADKLMKDGYNAEPIHGDLSQAQRDHVMQRFRDKSLHMLVATDVAARGIDVNDLTHVINYNLPDSLETYVHRSGRTGRANNEGTCLTIINAREGRRIRQVEDKIGRKIEYKPVPDGSIICKRRLFSLIKEVEEVEVNEEQIMEFLPDVMKQVESMSREELIKRFVSVEFNRFLEYYRNAGDLNVAPASERGKKKNKKEGRGSKGGDFTRYFINVGKEHKMSPRELITLINQTLKGHTFNIGNIDLQTNFSFVEVEAGYEELMLRSFKYTKFRGRKINVEVANPKPTGGRRKGNFKKKRKFKKKR